VLALALEVVTLGAVRCIHKVQDVVCVEQIPHAPPFLDVDEAVAVLLAQGDSVKVPGVSEVFGERVCAPLALGLVGEDSGTFAFA
jgi:hypothetical protein